MQLGEFFKVPEEQYILKYVSSRDCGTKDLIKLNTPPMEEFDKLTIEPWMISKLGLYGNYLITYAFLVQNGRFNIDCDDDLIDVLDAYLDPRIQMQECLDFLFHWKYVELKTMHWNEAYPEDKIDDEENIDSMYKIYFPIIPEEFKTVEGM